MGAMSTGDERLEAVGETIEEAKQAADKVSDQENLELGHRERPDPSADHGAGEDIDDAGEDEAADDEAADDKAGDVEAAEAAADEETPADDKPAEEKLSP